MIYVDTSALVKLLFEEPESQALARWLRRKGTTPKFSSDIAVVELLRTCALLDVSLLNDARRLLDGIDLVPLDHFILEQAAVLTPYELRSLGALHLASALSLRDEMTDFVAYDARLISAAIKNGLAVVSPV